MQVPWLDFIHFLDFCGSVSAFVQRPDNESSARLGVGGEATPPGRLTCRAPSDRGRPPGQE